MELLRLGPVGDERPFVREAGVFYDLAPLTSDIDGAFLAADGIARVREALVQCELSEVDVDGVLDCDGTAVQVRGRLDRLERDDEGRLVVVDIKTGKTPVSKTDAARHAQLAMYQLAIAEGLLQQGDTPGGGRLVYLGKPSASGPTERQQDPLTPDTGGQWRELVGKAAAATRGPQFVARVNDGCAHCPVRQNCPAQTDADDR